MENKIIGLENRYYVKKLNDATGKHDGCWYFVLDPKHDRAALHALAEYARQVYYTYPQLSKDLLTKCREEYGY